MRVPTPCPGTPSSRAPANRHQFTHSIPETSEETDPRDDALVLLAPDGAGRVDDAARAGEAHRVREDRELEVAQRADPLLGLFLGRLGQQVVQSGWDAGSGCEGQYVSGGR